MEPINKHRHSQQDPDEQGKRGLMAAIAGLGLLLVGLFWRVVKHEPSEQMSSHSPTRAASAGSARPGKSRTEASQDLVSASGDSGELPDAEAIAQGYEQDQLRARGLLWLLVGFFVTMAVVFGIITWFQTALTGRLPDVSRPALGIEDRPTTPVPDIVPRRAASGLERTELRAEEEAILSSYGWVDQEAGVVRIPIERAIDLLAERGLPAREESQQEEFLDQGLGQPLDASSGRMEELIPIGTGQ